MNEKTEFRNAWITFTKRLIFLKHSAQKARSCYEQTVSDFIVQAGDPPGPWSTLRPI